ncbi:dimethylsulfonioproprionate lyase family protein [Octadecabacter sp. R77987]|uniref:dimethylsulfonioproprionate lyase family protein n=1 Tax=Octadecabacter sp. R77987 TaxID=3093874 RepID=UPI00366C7C93
MTTGVWDSLLSEFAQVYAATPRLQAFCAFPNDISRQGVLAHDIPARALLESDPGLTTDDYTGLRDAFIAASSHALWRETYKGTDIDQDFLDRFGCYCLIGHGGAFSSESLFAYVVYMPANLHYPWHDHPAEEIYFVLAGEAEFHRQGEPSEVLKSGEVSFHTSSQPHAMTTHDHPVMALVLWRDGFATSPKLT